MALKSIMGTGLALALLVACGESDRPLLGERLDIRADTTAEFVNQALPISLPASVSNAEWTHRGGTPAHTLSNPALAPNLTQIFAVNIGEGNGRRARITADPVVAGGRVFAMDSRAQVVAVSTGGAPLWVAALSSRSDNRRDASGGGLAVNGDTVFATTGFGALIALDAATGDELWRQDLDASGGLCAHCGR